jgi:molecular chaperone IbpA
MFYFTTLKTSELDKLNRHTIDVFDRLDSLFKRQDFTNSMATNYPPYNIKRQDDQYLIEMAIAGFDKEDISITKEKEYLLIEGKKEQSADDKMVYQGIATRNFRKSFVLGERMKVIGAELKDGMLYVGLHQEIPEEEKPQTIEISKGKLSKHMLLAA